MSRYKHIYTYIEERFSWNSVTSSTSSAHLSKPCNRVVMTNYKAGDIT